MLEGSAGGTAGADVPVSPTCFIPQALSRTTLASAARWKSAGGLTPLRYYRGGTRPPRKSHAFGQSFGGTFSNPGHRFEPLQRAERAARLAMLQNPLRQNGSDPWQVLDLSLSGDIEVDSALSPRLRWVRCPISALGDRGYVELGPGVRRCFLADALAAGGASAAGSAFPRRAVGKRRIHRGELVNEPRRVGWWRIAALGPGTDDANARAEEGHGEEKGDCLTFLDSHRTGMSSRVPPRRIASLPTTSEFGHGRSGASLRLHFRLSQARTAKSRRRKEMRRGPRLVGRHVRPGRHHAELRSSRRRRARPVR